MSVAAVNESQSPSSFQDTDIVTEIENFTTDVFALKRKWEQACIAMDLLPSTIKGDLKPAYNQFQEFLNTAQEVANKARSEYLQPFCVKVLGSAIEPGIEKEVMLGEAQDLLDRIDNGEKSKWTNVATRALSKSLADTLEALEKKLYSTVPDSIPPTTFKKVDLLIERQHVCQGKITRDLEGESGHRIRSLLSLIWFFLKITPSKIRKILSKFIGEGIKENENLNALVKDNEDFANNLDAAQKDLLRPKPINKMASGDKEKVTEVVDSIREIISAFKLIAPKLDQICVISNTIKGTLNAWIEFLTKPHTSSEDMDAYIHALKLADGMYQPISKALAIFCGRQT